MTDTQLYLAIGVPCTVFLASLALTMWNMSGFRDDIREMRKDLKDIVGKLGTMDVELGKLMDRIK